MQLVKEVTMYLPIGKKCNQLYGVKVPELRSPSEFQWNSIDKIDQHKCIETILQRNFDLERAKYDSERIVKQQRLNELRQNVKETKLKLSRLKDGEYHVIKHLLTGYKSSIRVGKSLDKLFKHCDCKLNDKRRESDRLNYELNKLTDAYASKLKILAKMRDRHCQKYASDSYRLLANRVKRHAVLLDQSEHEIRNYENLLEDLKSAIKYLSIESLQYASTLKSLENEINEQNTHLNWLKMVKVASVERPTVNEEQRLRMMKKEMFDEPNQPRDIEDQVPGQNDPKMTNVDEPIIRKIDNASELPEQLRSIVQRIQSKLVAGEEKVNVLKNQLRGVYEKNGKDTMQNSSKEDDRNRQQSALDLQDQQNNPSIFERISDNLSRSRDVKQRFDDLLRNVHEKLLKLK